MLVGSSRDKPARLDDLLDPRLAAKLDRLDLRTRKIFAGKLQGERRSKKRGQSVEFDDYRDYVPGDDLRHIDWNVYARFDRLFIKLFLEEEDLSLHVVLDASPSMDAGRPSKLLFGAKLAMAMAYIGLVGNNRVGMSIFGAGPTMRLADVRGKHHLPRVARFILDQAWPESRASNNQGNSATPNFGEALTTIAKQRRGKGVMVVISDFLVDPSLGGYESGLRSLAAAGGFETTCIQVLSPGEISPERESEEGLAGDLRLTDIETGRAAEVTLSAALIKKYKQRLEEYCNSLRAFCAARRISHFVAKSDSDLEILILETLRRQGLVG